MATLAHDRTRQFARDWQALFPSAVISGVIGDEAHRSRGGYHISVEDQPATNYSVIRPDDKAPPGSWSRRHASAVDMSMNRTDMIRCTTRVRAVHRDPTDPRRRYLNAVNGWRGSGDAERYDFYAGTVGWADAGHQSHVHLEFRRRYVTDPAAYKAALSILAGESKATYLAALNPPKVAPTPPPVVAAGRPLIYQYAI